MDGTGPGRIDEMDTTRPGRIDEMDATGRPTARPMALRLYLLGAVFLGLSALLGGLTLVRNPGDDPLGMPVKWSEDSPFRSYFVPGLVLCSVFGVGSFAVVFGIFRRRAWAALATLASRPSVREYLANRATRTA